MTHHSFGCNSNEGGVCNCEGIPYNKDDLNRRVFELGNPATPGYKVTTANADSSDLNDHIIDDTQENALGNFHIEEDQDPLEDKLRERIRIIREESGIEVSPACEEIVIREVQLALHSDRERVRKEVEKVSTKPFTTGDYEGDSYERTRIQGRQEMKKTILSIITHNH